MLSVQVSPLLAKRLPYVAPSIYFSEGRRTTEKMVKVKNKDTGAIYEKDEDQVDPAHEKQMRHA
jgi:hypothetical protein